MSMVLNEDQMMLKDAVRGYCLTNAPVSVLRYLRDQQSEDGFSRELWRQMVDLGWAGMTIPEQYDGFGFGYGGLEIVLEETGRTLVPTPLVSTVLLCATAINLGGSEEQKSALLPAIVKGELIMALALEETPFHNPTRIATTARPQGAGYVLNGSKQLVIDGHIADKLIVVARTAGGQDDKEGISLFMVDRTATGVDVRRTLMVDSRNAAHVTLNNVQVDEEALLGDLHNGFIVLEKTLDIGRIGLAAEMLGNAQEVFDRIIDYLKQREQFGVLIGSFQGLQHRAAHMYSELELCRSAVRRAFDELDGAQEDIPILASIAKAKLSEVLCNISNEGVQMHGGIGMTDEFDIGFYLKRARVAQVLLGDATFHRDRYATLSGF
ncbi:MAG: acyl-CoA dehydrogenase family protein [Gammaproteobacteria bacterium]|nr:acyl-CoA dehydrogenase family protein [Gammaproteobacteria bacterium]MDP2141720.1 acyl-CoA dehydrogenase family protein [Gammaproteobacteria bacterium]MDP2347955.1 acyl-CoA dehydrogenase family protein [Gammaproteobacteria bacterium]